MWRFAPCKGIRNPWNFCLWNPESGKILLVESGIRENFACWFQNPGKVCLWNLESEKVLLVASGIRENFACGIPNLGNFSLWNPEFWALEFGIQPNPTNDWNPESKSNWQRLESSTWNPESTGVESRIQDFLGFTCMGGEECGLVPVDGIPS